MDITPEQIEAYQRQQAEQERATQAACVKALIELAANLGFEIGAIAEPIPDGREGVIAVAAKWGVRRK